MVLIAATLSTAVWMRATGHPVDRWESTNTAELVLNDWSPDGLSWGNAQIANVNVRHTLTLAGLDSSYTHRNDVRILCNTGDASLILSLDDQRSMTWNRIHALWSWPELVSEGPFVLHGNSCATLRRNGAFDPWELVGRHEIDPPRS